MCRQEGGNQFGWEVLLWGRVLGLCWRKSKSRECVQYQTLTCPIRNACLFSTAKPFSTVYPNEHDPGFTTPQHDRTLLLKESALTFLSLHSTNGNLNEVLSLIYYMLPYHSI